MCTCRIDEILIPSQVTHISVTIATTMKSITHTIVMFLVHVHCTYTNILGFIMKKKMVLVAYNKLILLLINNYKSCEVYISNGQLVFQNYSKLMQMAVFQDLESASL